MTIGVDVFPQVSGGVAPPPALTCGQPQGNEPSTHTEPYHYAVIGRAIENIAARAPGQVSLDEVAAGVGLSPAHFQRVFSQWVGVSPKRYQQYLTLDHAKRLLAERHSVLDTAYASGLSGSGRLHDLFLRWEAMSPGEYARAGEGLEIAYGWFETPFGPALAMGTERGLCGLAFAAETGRAAALADLTRPLAEGGLRRGARSGSSPGSRPPSAAARPGCT